MPEMPGVPCKPRRALCPAGGNRLLVSLEIIAVVGTIVVSKLAASDSPIFYSPLERGHEQ